MAERPPGDRTVQPSDPGIIEAIRIDLVRLHERWMGLAFPRQQAQAHSVLGKWKPRTPTGRAKYSIWGVLGGLVIAVLYPLAVVGFAVRFYTRRISRSAASIGLAGVLILSVLVWGGLTAFARMQFSYEGFVAVAAAGGVATFSAMLAFLFARIDGRFTTVVFAYPFAVTSIFLPPVVAAFYSPTLASVVFPSSQLLSIWFLENVLNFWGMDDWMRRTFDLVGLAYVGMWFAIAVPVGWTLGILVTLANVVRPSRSSGSENGSEPSG